MAEKKVDLRNQGRDNADLPPPTEVNVPGFKGTLPFAPAKTIGNHIKVPDDVRAEEQRFKNEPIVTPEKEKRKALKDPPPVVQLESLPEERQDEILSSIAAASALKPQERPFIPRGPGIAQAKALADKVAADTEKKLTGQKPAPAPRPKIHQPEAVETFEPAPEVPVPQQDTDNEICVHCGWARGNKDGCNPTTIDKQIFVAAVLGQQRFTKEYGLLRGQMRVTFRSLTVEENDLVIKQLMADWNAGRITGPAHSVAEATKYQLALALASVETNVGPITIPTLDEYDCDPPTNGTVLPEIVTYVNKQALQNEHTRRIISKAYGHFIETVSKLEAMAEAPDFWPATED
jgi:hypothetical protein